MFIKGGNALKLCAETPEVTAPGPQPATRATRPHTLAAVAAARSPQVAAAATATAPAPGPTSLLRPSLLAACLAPLTTPEATPETAALSRAAVACLGWD